MNRIQEALTKFFYIKFKGGKFTGVRKVRLPYIGKIDVFTIKMKDWIFGAQATIFRTIIVEESLFKKKRYIQNHVLVHEYMHNRRFLLSMFFTVIAILSGIYSVSALMGFITFFVLSFLRHSQIYTFYSVVSFFGLVIGMMVFSSSSWIMELKAEFDTMDVLGRKSLERMIKSRKLRKSRKPMLNRILYRLTHPPDKWTLKLYDFFKK